MGYLCKGDFMIKKMFTTAFLVSQIASFSASAEVMTENSVKKHVDYGDNSGHFLLTSTDENFSLGFKGLLQQKTEVSYADKKSNVTLSLPKARLKLFGRVFHPNINYFVQTQFEKSDHLSKKLTPSFYKYDVTGTSYLQDYYLNVGMPEHAIHTRFGKFTMPFSRHYMVGGAQLRSPVHSLAREAFEITDNNKDVGVMIHSGFNIPIEYALAVVSNGLVGRLGYNHKGIDAFELVDFKGGDARFGVGFGGFLHTDYLTNELNDYRATLDFIFKLKNTSSHGEVYYANRKKIQSFGANIDVGYLLHKVEPVVHYSYYKPNLDMKDQAHEVTLGANYYIYGHNLKAQPYFGMQHNIKAANTFLGGVQLQFAF